MNELKLYEENRINLDEDKFLQRMIIENKYGKKICKWIIENFEIYENYNKDWISNVYFTNSAGNEKNVFYLEKIETIFPFILDSFNSIIDDVIKSYSLNDKYIYKITEIFLEKHEQLNEENIYYTNSDIVINILLKNDNLNKEFVRFSDGTISNIEIGNMIIYSSKSRHYKIKTNNTPMYVLVGLIKIFER